ncbi:hypothetical protein B0T36_25435, partial [Nocardia donostiensis]
MLSPRLLHVYPPRPHRRHQLFLPRLTRLPSPSGCGPARVSALAAGSAGADGRPTLAGSAGADGRPTLAHAPKAQVA